VVRYEVALIIVKPARRTSLAVSPAVSYRRKAACLSVYYIAQAILLGVTAGQDIFSD